MTNERKYENLFAVSPIKRKTRLADGSIQEKSSYQTEHHALRNENIYSEDGNLIEIADQMTYNSSFFIKLSLMYIGDIPDFLDYHFRRTSNKENYLNLLNFGFANDKTLGNGTKEIVQHWAKKKMDKINWKIDAHNPLENFYQWSEKTQTYLTAVFSSGKHKIVQLSDDYDQEQDHISTIIYKAQREIEAQYLNNNSKEIIKRIVGSKFEYIAKFSNDLIEQFKMNHVDNMHSFLPYFQVCRSGVWEFHNWYKYLIGEIDNLNDMEQKLDSRKKITFDDFFKSEIEDKKRKIIKEKYKNLVGKQLAILIYLLQSEFKVIEIYPHSKDRSRSHFVKVLTANNEIKMQGINKYFDASTDKINVREEDQDYATLKSELNALLN